MSDQKPVPIPIVSGLAQSSWGGRMAQMWMALGASSAVLILSVFSFYYAFSLNDKITPKNMVISHGVVMGVFAAYEVGVGVLWYLHQMTSAPTTSKDLNMARGRFVTFVFWHYWIFLVWGLLWLKNYTNEKPQPAPEEARFWSWHAFQGLYSLFAMIYAANGYSYALALAYTSDLDVPSTGRAERHSNPSTWRKAHTFFVFAMNLLACFMTTWMFFVMCGFTSAISFDGFFYMHIVTGALWLAGVATLIGEYWVELGTQLFWSFFESRRSTIFFTMWYAWAMLVFIVSADTKEYKTNDHGKFIPGEAVQSDFYVIRQIFYTCNAVLASYFLYNCITALILLVNQTDADYSRVVADTTDLSDLAENAPWYKAGPKYVVYGYRAIVLLAYAYQVVHVLWMFPELQENYDVNHYIRSWGISYASISGVLWFVLMGFAIAQGIDHDSQLRAGGILRKTSALRTVAALGLAFFQGALAYLWFSETYGDNGAVPTMTIKDPAEKEHYMFANMTTFEFGLFFTTIIYLNEVFFVANITEWMVPGSISDGSTIEQIGAVFGLLFMGAGSTASKTVDTSLLAGQTAVQSASNVAAAGTRAAAGTANVALGGGYNEMRNRGATQPLI